MADETPTEMDFTASQGNDDDASHPEGSWTTVSANRKPASTARPRTELITVGIQLPPWDTHAQTASVRLSCFHHRRRKSLAQNQCGGHPSGPNQLRALCF
ncbi:hypothetical protein MTO96_000502 [Rhipicephalus appendiculatus]